MIVKSDNKPISALYNKKASTGLPGDISVVCAKFLASRWTIAVGEPTPLGEIVMSVATIVVAGVLLYEVITCKTATDNSANPHYSYCMFTDGCPVLLQSLTDVRHAYNTV